ncbi:MAG TPA: hypothetical protein VIM58_05325 [Candidatus Methylacidiphilales bacterium]
MPKKIELDAFEQGIEDSIERGEWKPVSKAKKAELMAKLRLAHENLLKGRGGPRPNAGRKALGHVRLGLNVKPETRAFLLAEAGGKARGMGAVLDRLAAKARKQRSA